MRLDRIAGGMCLGAGATRLIIGATPSVYSWILLGLGIFAVILYLIESYAPGISDYCKRYDSMTNEERIADCEHRIAEKEANKC